MIADTFHDFGKNNNDRRCKLGNSRVVDQLKQALKYYSSPIPEIVDTISPGSTQLTSIGDYEDKAIHFMLNSSEITDRPNMKEEIVGVTLNDLKETLSKMYQNQKVGLVIDMGINKRMLFDDPNSSTPQFINIVNIAGDWDEATKSAFNAIDINITNNDNEIQIQPMTSLLPDSMSIGFINAKLGQDIQLIINKQPETNCLHAFGVNFPRVVLKNKLLKCSVSNLCRAISYLNNQNDQQDAALFYLMGKSFDVPSMGTKPSVLKNEIHKLLQGAFQKYPQSQAGAQEDFKRFCFDLKRSMDYGLVYMTQHLAREKLAGKNPYYIDKVYSGNNETNINNNNIELDKFCLITGDRLCYLKARLEGVDAILMKKNTRSANLSCGEIDMQKIFESRKGYANVVTTQAPQITIDEYGWAPGSDFIQRLPRGDNLMLNLNDVQLYSQVNDQYREMLFSFNNIKESIDDIFELREQISKITDTNRKVFIGIDIGNNLTIQKNKDNIWKIAVKGQFSLDHELDTVDKLDTVDNLFKLLDLNRTINKLKKLSTQTLPDYFDVNTKKEELQASFISFLTFSQKCLSDLLSKKDKDLSDNTSPQVLEDDVEDDFDDESEIAISSQQPTPHERIMDETTSKRLKKVYNQALKSSERIKNLDTLNVSELIQRYINLLKPQTIETIIPPNAKESKFLQICFAACGISKNLNISCRLKRFKQEYNHLISEENNLPKPNQTQTQKHLPLLVKRLAGGHLMDFNAPVMSIALALSIDIDIRDFIGVVNTIFKGPFKGETTEHPLVTSLYQKYLRLLREYIPTINDEHYSKLEELKAHSNDLGRVFNLIATKAIGLANKITNRVNSLKEELNKFYDMNITGGGPNDGGTNIEYLDEYDDIYVPHSLCCITSVQENEVKDDEKIIHVEDSNTYGYEVFDLEQSTFYPNFVSTKTKLIEKTTSVEFTQPIHQLTQQYSQYSQSDTDMTQQYNNVNSSMSSQYGPHISNNSQETQNTQPQVGTVKRKQSNNTTSPDPKKQKILIHDNKKGCLQNEEFQISQKLGLILDDLYWFHAFGKNLDDFHYTKTKIINRILKCNDMIVKLQHIICTPTDTYTFNDVSSKYFKVIKSFMEDEFDKSSQSKSNNTPSLHIQSPGSPIHSSSSQPSQMSLTSYFGGYSIFTDSFRMNLFKYNLKKMLQKRATSRRLSQGDSLF